MPMNVSEARADLLRVDEPPDRSRPQFKIVVSAAEPTFPLARDVGIADEILILAAG